MRTIWNVAAAIEPSLTTERVILNDGRSLGFAEYGDPNGEPVLEFHGWPSCRTEAWFYDEAGKKLGARIIGIDRPGFGISTFKEGYRILDWPADVVEFANALGLRRFAVLGLSSGSAYALACARFIPERLSACTLVGGMPPLKVQGEKLRPYILPLEIHTARLANAVPLLARAPLWYIRRLIQKDPQRAMKQLVKRAPPSELELLTDERATYQFQRTVAEACRAGLKGLIASVALQVKDWGFRLRDITTHVTLWHGELDTLVFPSSAHYTAANLPNHKLHMIPGAGHLTIIVRHAHEVLRSCCRRTVAQATTASA